MFAKIDASVDSPTRLEAAISAINQLLDSYDALGEVRVRLFTFGSRSSIIGNEWTTVAEAKSLLSTIDTGGSTNYEAALTASQQAFTTAGKLASGHNIAYFLSDGVPNLRETYITKLEGGWKTFLTSNQITSFALGMSSDAKPEPLRPNYPDTILFVYVD